MGFNRHTDIKKIVFKKQAGKAMIINGGNCSKCIPLSICVKKIFFLRAHFCVIKQNLGNIVEMIRKDLKASSQCVKIVKTVNQILAMIKRTFTFKTKDNLLQLYKCLVRPHLE